MAEHGYLLAKSLLVSFSWVFGYFALKHLPLSTAGPIRSTGPLWTVLIAVLLVGEKPSLNQWIGVGIILVAFYAFSLVGKLDGNDFRKNIWVWYMVAATVLGACSSIYDKFLLQSVGIAPSTVQAWFSVYLAGIFLPIYLLWRRGIWKTGRFEWRWSIPLIGIGLLVADILYFTAVSDPDALISIVSPLRRMSVLVTFFGGVILLKERTYVGWKIACLAVMLAGVVILNR
ncbi:MAG: EamA family transporter [Verrucomicrobiota bacterium]